MTNLDELHAQVTAAILDAERLPFGSLEARTAFRRVCDVEEHIATLASSETVEGEIARLGAVQAALSADEPLRALQLAEQFAQESLSGPTRAKLEESMRAADAELAATEQPRVEPIRFHIAA